MFAKNVPAVLFTILATTCINIISKTTKAENIQPEITAEVAKIIKVDNHKFKDLNKNGTLDTYEDWRQPVEMRIDDLLSRMTLPEKIGQMFHPRMYTPESGKIDDTVVIYKKELYSPAMANRMILQLHITHFLNNGYSSPSKMAIWTNHIQKIAEGARLGIPVIFFGDPRWEPVLPIGLAATRDADLVERFGRASAQRYRAIGFHEGHKLYLGVATEPRWGRLSSTLGEDATLCAELVNAYIKGCQGDELGKDSMIFFAVIFPGGGPQKDGMDPHREKGKDMIYPGNNLDYHLIPWKSAINRGIWKVMPYYGIPRCLDNVGANYSHAIITGLLRKKLGYDRLICTDWGMFKRPWGLKEKLGHTPSRKEMTTLLLKAGVDQIGVWTNKNVDQIDTCLELVNEGIISKQQIDDSIRRIMINKFKLGLFENPYVDPANAEKVLNSEEHKQLEREARLKSNILLKNKNILPLSKNSTIFATGIDAKEISKYAKLVRNPKDAEIAVVRINYKPDWHEQNLNLPTTLHNKIKKIVDTGTPTVLVINMDRPLVMPWVIENVSAIIATYGATDDVVVETLFGDYNPSGKLAIEIPRSMEAVEKQYEDLPWDSEDPIFPFGYGMNYDYAKLSAKYKIKDLHVSATEIRAGEDFVFDALVKNVQYDQCIVFRAYIDGQIVSTKPYGLKAGMEHRIIFTQGIYEQGSHTITIEDLPPITVHVGSPTDTLEYFEIMGNKPTKD